MEEEKRWSKHCSENQGSEVGKPIIDPRVIALDPGVRSFLKGYSPGDGGIVDVAPQDIQRLCRISHHIDRLSGKLDAPDLTHKQRLRMRRARLRMYGRIRTLTDEVHWKTCDFLCKNYDVIMLPTFGTSEMVKKRSKPGKKTRKISRNTARRLLLWRHYTFRQRLIEKARQWGRVLMIVNESYTTKTCTRCGWSNDKIKGKKRFICQDCFMDIDRDDNGSRNICIRTACC
jgi:putative transposase